jgi:hypothetical protein
VRVLMGGPGRAPRVREGEERHISCLKNSL